MKQAPFDLTPNPRFLFHSGKHREALNHLLYGIRERKGFVQLTGEVGAGKTTLCRAMLEQLDGHFSTAVILNPVLNADELMKAIATEFGLDARGRDRLDVIALISGFLLKQVEQGRESVLIIDESQNLTEELLEQVRLLSNIETDDRKLLQIVLLGQQELRDRLNSPRLRLGLAFLSSGLSWRFWPSPWLRSRSSCASPAARNTMGFSCLQPLPPPPFWLCACHSALTPLPRPRLQTAVRR